MKKYSILIIILISIISLLIKPQNLIATKYNGGYDYSEHKAQVICDQVFPELY